MKKILLGIVCLFSVLSLTGCGEKEVNVNSYVGTYEKNISTMGTIYGGHLINMYEDGTLEIYYGFYGTVGTSNGVMLGEYSTQESKTSISYTLNETLYETSFEISEDSFRAQIFLAQSMPDDSSDSNSPGLTYYEVGYNDFNKMSNVLIGAQSIDNNHVAYFLELKVDDTFVLYSNFNGKFVKIEGSYKKVVKGIDDDNEIEFTYKLDSSEKTSSFIYNNTYAFEFNIENNLNVINTNVMLVRFQ